MRIEITDGSTTTVLASGATNAAGEPAGPIGLSLTGSVETQLRTFLRGTVAKNTNRGNANTSVGFSVAYRFDSIADAQIFGLVHYSTVLREGTLRFWINDDNHVDLSDTVIQSVDVRCRGARVDVTYAAVGGQASLTSGPQEHVSFDADGEGMVDASGQGMVFQTAEESGDAEAADSVDAAGEEMVDASGEKIVTQ